MRSITIPHGAVLPIPTDDTFDLYLDRRLVASGFPSAYEAQLELEQIRFQAMFGEALPQGEGDFSDDLLASAYSVFILLFTTPAVHTRAERALHDILTPEPPPYTILPDGTLRILASSVRRGPSAYTIATTRSPKSVDTDEVSAAYRVRETCTCPDYRTRSAEHGGTCKHIAAKRILFLAQQGHDTLHALHAALAAASEAATTASSQLTSPGTVPVAVLHAVLAEYPLPWHVEADPACARLVAANDATVLAGTGDEASIMQSIVWMLATHDHLDQLIDAIRNDMQTDLFAL